MVFRMIRLFIKRKELIESAGLIYTYTMFDLVYVVLIKEKYYKVFDVQKIFEQDKLLELGLTHKKYR